MPNPGGNSKVKRKHTEYKSLTHAKLKALQQYSDRKKFAGSAKYIFLTLLVIMLQFTFKQLTPGHRLIVYSYIYIQTTKEEKKKRKKLAASTEDTFYRETLKSSKDA